MTDPTHDLMRSTVETKMEKSKIKEMRFPLLIRNIPVCLIVFHHCITKFTRISLAKYRVVAKNKKLKSNSLWPLSLICQIGSTSVKIVVTYHPKKDKFLVKVNNIHYFKLPFKAVTYNPNAPREYLFGDIKVNDTALVAGSIPWI